MIIISQLVQAPSRGHEKETTGLNPSPYRRLLG
jgi:hypothetical protein